MKKASSLRTADLKAQLDTETVLSKTNLDPSTSGHCCFSDALYVVLYMHYLRVDVPVLIDCYIYVYIIFSIDFIPVLHEERVSVCC
jgi:hypothetical protein